MVSKQINLIIITKNEAECDVNCMIYVVHKPALLMVELSLLKNKKKSDQKGVKTCNSHSKLMNIHVSKYIWKPSLRASKSNGV